MPLSGGDVDALACLVGVDLAPPVATEGQATHQLVNYQSINPKVELGLALAEHALAGSPATSCLDGCGSRQPAWLQVQCSCPGTNGPIRAIIFKPRTKVQRPHRGDKSARTSRRGVSLWSSELYVKFALSGSAVLLAVSCEYRSSSA